ncbi:hypothetical protein [Nocardia asteroides]|uniref:hypothetical protein n=1 Tax=Nocardia asteroides TaxID=1824 RepID=UPI003651855D
MGRPSLELGFGSGMTWRRRLRDWQAAKVFEAMYRAVLDRSNAAWTAGVTAPPDQGSGHRQDYDYPSRYAELRQRGITRYISRRGIRDKVTAGRWIVEQTFALLHQYRRLAIRLVRRIDSHYGLRNLRAALTCWRRLSNRTR